MLRRVLGADAIRVPWRLTDDQGEPVNMGSVAPAVRAVRASDGGSVGVSGVAADVGWWVAALAGADVPAVDTVVCTFTPQGRAPRDVHVRVVGGAYFALADVHVSGWEVPGQTDVLRRAAARHMAVAECELLCNRAFVPVYAEAVVQVTSYRARSVLLPHTDVLEVVSAVTPEGVSVPVDVVDPVGVVALRDSGVMAQGLWAFKFRHGMLAPPPDVVNALQQRWSHWLVVAESTIPDRATSYSLETGTTYRLALASRRRTGYPEVDAVYARYRVPSLA